MRKLGKVLKAVGRFVNGAIKDMLADTRAGRDERRGRGCTAGLGTGRTWASKASTRSRLADK
jgi:hypothetical protein